MIGEDLQKFSESRVMRTIAIGRVPIRNLPKIRASRCVELPLRLPVCQISWLIFFPRTTSTQMRSRRISKPVSPSGAVGPWPVMATRTPTTVLEPLQWLSFIGP
ncbi:hypothetical protein AVEN_98908-1 [Araneus ventricosus]|uniref:Uncharacterized protein n=1 Tax=Araneus ventricosus TaxID=182803 RepID=A0A4Y2T7S6_ARAVE|nr:hypothetical protein AVEN_98908-1 [Araneus ventricosus]